MNKIRKLGTIDLDIVESNPIVFQGHPWLMEYVRQKGPHGPSHSYYDNATGNAYCRFRSLEDLRTFSAPFGVGSCFGCAFADNDHLAVTVTDAWGGTGFYLLESNDMEHWSAPVPVFTGSGFKCYNSSLCRAGGRYVNALEVGTEEDASQNHMIFAESPDLKHWNLIPGAYFPKGAPVLRHFDGWFFYVGLFGDYTKGFNTCIFRSQDLIDWEASPANPILAFDAEDRKIHPLAPLTEAQKAVIARAADLNDSDMDFCEYHGKVIVSYSWGDQAGHEFLALGEADGTERDFCFSWFE